MKQNKFKIYSTGDAVFNLPKEKNIIYNNEYGNDILLCNDSDNTFDTLKVMERSLVF